MPSKEDLLNELTVKQLRQLAKENKVSLVSEGFLWNSTTSTKEEIVEVLSNSVKITKEKISSLSKEPEITSQRIVEKNQVSKEIIRKKGEVITEKKAIVKESEVKAIETEFEKVLNEINAFKKVAPPVRTLKKAEKMCANSLVSYLRHSFPDIKEQYRMGIGTRIDAIIGRTGLEVKFRPDQNEIIDYMVKLMNICNIWIT
jgi:hypothetical protein